VKLWVCPGERKAPERGGEQISGAYGDIMRGKKLKPHNANIILLRFYMVQILGNKKPLKGYFGLQGPGVHSGGEYIKNPFGASITSRFFMVSN